eukprot:3601714-Amphidinium_carterae.1
MESIQVAAALASHFQRSERTSPSLVVATRSLSSLDKASFTKSMRCMFDFLAQSAELNVDQAMQKAPSVAFSPYDEGGNIGCIKASSPSRCCAATACVGCCWVLSCTCSLTAAGGGPGHVTTGKFDNTHLEEILSQTPCMCHCPTDLAPVPLVGEVEPLNMARRVLAMPAVHEC